MIYILPAFCAVLVYVFLEKEAEKQYVPAVILKGLASLCFVSIGQLCNPGNQVSNLIVMGLIIGFIADILLNLRMVVKEKGQTIFLIGILVFLTGHIMYLAAVLPLCSSKLTCIIIGIVLTTLLMIWIFKRVTAKPAFSCGLPATASCACRDMKRKQERQRSRRLTTFLQSLFCIQLDRSLKAG